mmetsp:Transcript_14497/g.30505  ORF Transcript_14497/g.30505 Transcript_14497/m.30505 type:complete len:203 (-) Transcript_14497:1125-1733(-)
MVFVSRSLLPIHMFAHNMCSEFLKMMPILCFFRSSVLIREFGIDPRNGRRPIPIIPVYYVHTLIDFACLQFCLQRHGHRLPTRSEQKPNFAQSFHKALGGVFPGDAFGFQIVVVFSFLNTRQEAEIASSPHDLGFEVVPYGGFNDFGLTMGSATATTNIRIEFLLFFFQFAREFSGCLFRDLLVCFLKTTMTSFVINPTIAF